MVSELYSNELKIQYSSGIHFSLPVSLFSVILYHISKYVSGDIIINKAFS